MAHNFYERSGGALPTFNSPSPKKRELRLTLISSMPGRYEVSSQPTYVAADDAAREWLKTLNVGESIATIEGEWVSILSQEDLVSGGALFEQYLKCEDRLVIPIDPNDTGDRTGTWWEIDLIGGIAT